MEFVLELLVQIVGDFVLGAMVGVFDGSRPTDGPHQTVRLIGFIFFGLVFGLIGAHFFPTFMLSSAALRGAWLLGSPATAALSVYVMHTLYFRSQSRAWPMVHAASLAFVFTFTRWLALS